MTSTKTSSSAAAKTGLLAFLGRTLFYARPYWGRTLVIVVALVLGAAFRLLVPWGFQQIFDRAVAERDVDYLFFILALLGGGWVVQVVAALVQDRLSADVGARMMNDLRRTMYAKLQRLPLGYFDRTDSGDLLSRFTTDLAILEPVYLRTMHIVVLSVLIVLPGAVLLVYMEWRLAILSGAVLAFAMRFSEVLGRRAQQKSYELKSYEGQVADAVHEAVAAPRVVRSFALETTKLAEFRSRLEELRQRVVSSSFAAVLVSRLAMQAVFFAQVMILGLGGYLAIHDILTLGIFAGFVSLLLNVTTAINYLGAVLPELYRAAGGMQRVEELLAEPERGANGVEPVALPRRAHEIRFDGVSFNYGEKQVLSDVSFTVKSGESVAILGPSGSGKSTVLNLVLGFYEPASGEITVDGVPLAAAEKSFRDNTGVVMQETILFKASLLENIRLGRPDASDAEIHAAASRASAIEVVHALAKGYSTPVGERGGQLSGGQRQRIGIARAILRDPTFLVLDEATSALDTVTENAVNRALMDFAQGRTVMATTHRLGTVKSMDRILVFVDGRLVEEGSHEELLAHQGAYHELWQKQSGFVVSEDGTRAECTAERLRAIPLLSQLGLEPLERLAKLLVSEQHPEDRELFQHGDPGDKFYLIVRGTVRVEVGRAVIKLQDGDYFGEIALLEEKPRSATVRTLTPTLLLSLSRRHFQDLLADEPEVRRMVEAEAARRRQRDESASYRTISMAAPIPSPD